MSKWHQLSRLIYNLIKEWINDEKPNAIELLYESNLSSIKKNYMFKPRLFIYLFGPLGLCMCVCVLFSYTSGSHWRLSKAWIRN